MPDGTTRLGCHPVWIWVAGGLVRIKEPTVFGAVVKGNAMSRMWWLPVGLLCLASTARAIGDFTEFQGNVDAVTSLGIGLWALPWLGATKLAGVGGVLAGVWIVPLGVLATACLVAYHGHAVVLHLTIGNGFADAVPALVMTIISGLALVSPVLRLRAGRRLTAR